MVKRLSVYTYTVSGLDVHCRCNDISTGHTSILRISEMTANVRMILPPSADGQASIVRTYTVSGLGAILEAWHFDGTYIHISRIVTDDNVRMILPPSSGWASPYRLYLHRQRSKHVPRRHDIRRDTHPHFADRDDDNVRMILPPSADGQALYQSAPIPLSGVNNNSRQ